MSEWQNRNEALLKQARGLRTELVAVGRAKLMQAGNSGADSIARSFDQTLQTSIDEAALKPFADIGAMAPEDRSAYCNKFASAASMGRLDLGTTLPEDVSYLQERKGAVAADSAARASPAPKPPGNP